MSYGSQGFLASNPLSTHGPVESPAKRFAKLAERRRLSVLRAFGHPLSRAGDGAHKIIWAGTAPAREICAWDQIRWRGAVLGFDNSRTAPPLTFKHIPVNPHPLKAVRGIRLGAVHQLADGKNFQRIVGRSLQCHFVRLAARASSFGRQSK